MNSPSIATRCYVPAELLALRLWLPAAAFMNVLIAGLERLRGNDGIAMLVLFAAVLLGMARWQLPDGDRPWKRPLAQALATLALAAAGWTVLARPSSFYDYWAAAWLLVPPALVVYWLFRPVVAGWCNGRHDPQMAEYGLARNRTAWPRLESIGLHIFLLHAAATVVIPVIWIFDVSISPGNILGGALFDAFTLEHYTNILGGEIFWTWTKNSIIVAIGTTLFGLLMAVPAGYAFSRWDFAGRKGSMFAFMLIQMFPGIIILVPYFMVMKTLGLLNTSLGLIIVYSVTALPLCVWML